MPEGHLIHRFADQLRQDLAGREVRASSPQGRFDAAALDGRVLRDVRAVGKHLIYEIESASALHVHLGMRGLFLRYPDPAVAPRSGVRLRVSTPDAAWDLIAPSTCEVLDPAGVERLLGSLGPDPLAPEDDAERAVRNMRASGAGVGAALLNQSVWAGIGNAWRAELLYLARLHPKTPCQALTAAEAAGLWELTRSLLAFGRDAGQVVSDPAAPAERWVYKRATCRGCGAVVATAPVAGRTAHWCPAEQRRGDERHAATARAQSPSG